MVKDKLFYSYTICEDPPESKYDGGTKKCVDPEAESEPTAAAINSG